MMKLTKKWWISLPIALVCASAAILPVSLDNMVLNSQQNTNDINLYDNKTIEYDDESSYSSSLNIEPKKVIDANEGSVVSTTRTLDFQETIFQGSDRIGVATPFGIFLSTNNGGVMFDPDTQNIVWRLTNQDGTASDIGRDGKRIFSSRYNTVFGEQGENTEEGGLIILSENSTNTMIVSLVNPKTGVIYDQSNPLNFAGRNTSDFNVALTPLTDTANGNLDTSSCYLITPRGRMKNSVRDAAMYRFWIDRSLKDSNCTPWSFSMLSNESVNTEKNILATSFSYITDSDVNGSPESWNAFMRIEQYVDGRVFLRIYKGRDNIYSHQFGTRGFNTSTSNVIYSITDSRTLYDPDTNTLTCTFMMNVDATQNAIAQYSYNWATNTFSQKIIDLNKNPLDYDSYNGYYDSQLKKFVTYNTYTNAQTVSVCLFDPNLDNNYNEASGKIVRYSLSSNDYPSAYRTNYSAKQFIPIITYGNDINEQNIFIFCRNDNKYLVLNAGSNYAEYPYGYNTTINSEITLPNVSSIKPNSDSLDVVNNQVKLQDNQEQFINSTKMNAEGVVYTVASISEISKEATYKGEFNASINASICYDNGKYVENKTIPDITLKGFYVWNTKSLQTINATPDIYNDYFKLDVSTINEWANTNKTSIFVDIPEDANVVVKNVQHNFDDQTITVTANLDKYIVNGQLENSTSGDFTFIVDNFLINTKAGEGINNDVSSTDLSSYYAYDVVDNYLVDLKTFLINNDFISGIKNTFSSNNIVQIDFGNIDNLLGSIEINSIYVNDYFVNGTNFTTSVKKIDINKTLVGFKKTTETQFIDTTLTYNDDSIYASEVSDEQLQEFIIANIDSILDTSLLPRDFGANTDIIVEKMSFNDSEVVVKVSLTKYFDQNGNYMNYPVLSHEYTINGFSTTFADTDILSKTYDVSNVSELSSLSINEITGYEVALYKYLIDNDDELIINKPSNFTIYDIAGINISQRIDNQITIDKITLFRYLENGDEVSGIKEFACTVVLSGFQPATSSESVSTTLKQQPLDLVTTSTSKLASEFNNDNLVKSELVSLLKANNFNNLPDPNITFTNDDVYILSYKANDYSGTLYVSFTLKSLIISDNIVTISDIDTNLAPIFNARINNFKSIIGWKQLSLELDFQNKNIYDTVNNGTLTNAFDYKTAIKEKLVNYVNDTSIANFDNETKINLISHLNDTTSNGFINSAKFNLTYNSTSSSLSVISSKLAELSNDNQWLTGYSFNITNVNYSPTTVTIKKSFSIDSNITYSEFKNNISTYVPSINDLVDLTNVPIENYTSSDSLSIPDLIKISAVNGSDEKGFGQIALTFKKFLTSEGAIENYTIILDRIFIFATSDNQGDTIDYLNDTIVASELGFANKTNQDLVNYLNDEANKNEINNILSQNKAKLIKTNNSTDVTLLISHATIVNNTTDSAYVTINIQNIGYDTILITGLSGIKATNITKNQSISSGLNATNISNYFLTGSEVNVTKVQEIITWNTESLLPSNDKATVIAVTVFGLSKNTDNENYSVYINFKFNGIYESSNANSYIANYVYQVLINNLPPNDSTSYAELNVINTNKTELFRDYKTLDKSDNNARVNDLIIIGIFSGLIGLTLIGVIMLLIYEKYKKKNK